MENATPYDVLEEKWTPVLETKALPEMNDHYKRKVTAVLLENTETALREQALNEAAARLRVVGNAPTAFNSAMDHLVVDEIDPMIDT